MKSLILSFCHIFLLITQYTSLTLTQCTGESNIGQCSHVNQTTTKLSVIEEYDVWIAINCYNITDYKEFQQLISSRTNSSRNETQELKIYNCPLPENGSSLSTTLHKLGILSYRHLLIQNYDLPTAQIKRQHLRDFQELQNLKLQMDNLKHLPSDLFMDATLRNLRTLVLKTNASEIPNNLFQNLVKLENLTIGHSLQSLSSGQFHNQKKLLVLNLSNNKLKNIASNIFPSNGLLQKIHLQNNLLQTLPWDIFAPVTSLTFININSNKFQNLPPKLFENNLQLRAFELTMNRGVDLLTLPEKFLSNLVHLKKVVINCGLESLPEDVFKNSTNINEIILHHNKLKNLPDNLLESQVKLIHLDLSHNNLNRINGKLFRNTEELEILKLSHNKLQTIQRNFSTKLDKLQTLDLSYNQLNSNFGIQLQTNTYLNNLYLQHNFISELFILHDKLPRYLRKLDLSFNKIYNLRGKNLELLYTNDLKLNLSHNRIQTIQLEDLGKYNLLNTLSVTTNLNHNPLHCDCKIFKSMKYLNENKKHLKFETENLTCWGPNQLKGKYIKDVKEMELLCSLESEEFGSSYKCPDECECLLRSSDNMLLMNCSYRNLSQIPHIESTRNTIFNGIELNLTGNQITKLPPLLKGGYAECTKLFLYQNKLSEINKSQIPLNITHLDLRHNDLQYLNRDTLAYLNASRFLQTIYLSGNKWKCDCSDTALFLLHTIQGNSTKFVDGSKVTCHGPQLFQKLNVLCQQKKIFNIIMICLSITIIFIILTLYYKFQNEIKIWLYSQNICRRIVAKNDNDDDLNKKYDAFISYSHKDENFIADYLVPELENGSPSFSLCVHVRDFVVGDYIPDQIVKSIADSRRIIVVLSKNFIESEWAKMEFKEAYRATLTERKNKIIAIIYEDIRDVNNLDKDLKLYLRTNTYLNWGDPRFWQKLRFAMPHKK